MRKHIISAGWKCHWVFLLAFAWAACSTTDDTNNDGNNGAQDAGDVRSADRNEGNDGSSQLCEPNAVHTCSCDELTSGSRRCNGEGDGYTSCECATVGDCEDAELVASGLIQTSFGDLDVSTASVSGGSAHRVDVDVQDGGGCIVAFGADIQLAEDGCILHVSFSQVDEQRGGLPYMEIELDSFCPGIPDESEGVYRTFDGGYGPFWFQGIDFMPDPAALTSCADGVTIGFPNQWITLYRSSPRDNAYVTLNIGELVLSGSLVSGGSPDNSCLEHKAGCGDGLADTGSGWCLPDGWCLPTEDEPACGEEYEQICFDGCVRWYECENDAPATEETYEYCEYDCEEPFHEDRRELNECRLDAATCVDVLACDD